MGDRRYRFDDWFDGLSRARQAALLAALVVLAVLTGVIYLAVPDLILEFDRD